ncbi:MAG: hypothetical protein ACE5F9_08260 [Phycisphaerae bacterium]
MGQISRKLAARLRDTRRQFRQMTEQARERIRIPKGVKDMEAHIQAGLDPILAAYASIQNLVSSFAESASTFEEFEPYYKIVSAAQDEYMPGGPPISPLTGSYFTTWAFFDCRFGPDDETIGTCFLDVSDVLELDDHTIEIMRRFQESRMGIYAHCGTIDNSKCILRELVTNREFTCHSASGYVGKEGEIWYVRLCPPLVDLLDYHVVVTTPYVLMDATETDWCAYLKRSMLEAGKSDATQNLYGLMKYGKSPNDWNEFVFLAYHHSQPNVIFLTGLPDVKGSLPHAT